MNRAELIDSVQNSLGDSTSRAEAERALTAVIDGITSALKNNEDVQLVGFGTFKISNRAARKGINPKTGEKIDIKASKSVKFSPGKALKESL